MRDDPGVSTSNGLGRTVGNRAGRNNKSPISLPELTRSLSVETGRLIEVFLKWSLCKWFPKYLDLDETDHLCTHDADRISRHLGKFLGDKSGNDGMTLNLTVLSIPNRCRY